MRGGEKCLEELCRMYPSADVYTLFYRPRRISSTINCHRVTSSFLSSLPLVEKYYRHLLPLFPFALWTLSRKLRRQDYDLVISVSHCVVKNIQPKKGTPHLCYCLTPARYFWDQFDAYFSKSLFQLPIRKIIEWLRDWDKRSAAAGTRFVAISRFIAQRIEKVLGEASNVVYPPVRNDWLEPREAGELGKGFLCVNALVPYKRVDLIVEAFNELGEELTIVGDGPELAELQGRAKENIKFIRYLDEKELAKAYRSAKALVFAAVEDFGIIPVEVQAAGRPVLCYGEGGSLETVIGIRKDTEPYRISDRDRLGDGDATGIFFLEPTPKAIVETVRSFLRQESAFTREACLANAEKFSVSRFQHGIRQELEELFRQKSQTVSGPGRPSNGLTQEEDPSQVRGNQ